MYRTLAHSLWKPLSILLAGTGLFLAYLLLKPVPSAQFTFGDNLRQGYGSYASSMMLAYGTACDQTRNRSQRYLMITNQAENFFESAR
jgi:hypothetical protein